MTVTAACARGLLLLCLALGPGTSALASLALQATSGEPGLVLLAGSEQDEAHGVAVDSAGNIYVTGSTYSDDFPIVNAAQPVRGNHGDSPDAFVTKISPAGTILYSTYLGGQSDDTGNAIAVDAQGNAYVTGDTYSSNFPTTPGSVQSHPVEGPFPPDVFVTKLSPSGKIVYSTFLGGGYADGGTGIAVDGSGAVTVTGFAGPQFPLVHPLQAQYRGLGEGGDDAFVARIDPSGKKLLYSTYLGGFDEGRGVAVDTAGNAYVTGTVRSAGFPTLHALQPKPGGGTCDDLGLQPKEGCPDAFVSKLTPAGKLAYSTYLGGSGADYGAGIAVDGVGRAFVTGSTASIRFPGLLPAHLEDPDAFLVMLGPTGPLIQATRLGGTGSTLGYAVSATDGRVALATVTDAQDVDAQNVASGWHGGFTDGVIAIYSTSAAGFVPLFRSYLGGSGDDTPLAAALDTTAAYVAGSTTSRTFGGQTVGNSGARGDAFAARVAIPDLPAPPATPTVPVSPASGLSPKQLYTRLLQTFTSQRSFQLTAVFQQSGAYDATVRYRLRFTAPNRLRVDRLDRAYFPSDTGGPGHTATSGSTEIQVGRIVCSGPINWTCSPAQSIDPLLQVKNLVLSPASTKHQHYHVVLFGPHPAVVTGFTADFATCPFYAASCPPERVRTVPYEDTLAFDPASLLPLGLHSTLRLTDRLLPYEQATFSSGTSTIALPHYPRVACPNWVPKSSYCMKEPGK